MGVLLLVFFVLCRGNELSSNRPNVSFLFEMLRDHLHWRVTKFKVPRFSQWGTRRRSCS
jgi:hypothetical protein